MKRILIAGDCTEKSISNPMSYINALRAVGSVGSVSFARDEADAEALAGAFDALLMPGGGDLPGSYFGQPSHPSVNSDHPNRDKSDKLMLDAFLKKGRRVLGICRGCQVSNVFLGGSLHQHLPDAFDQVIWHSGNITGRHMAIIEPGTVLAGLLHAGEMPVNSSHHQGCDRPGKGLAVVAKAPDGVIEALEGENILLLQWHPERMGEEMLPIFRWITGQL